jgi:hypothetical protein
MYGLDLMYNTKSLKIAATNPCHKAPRIKAFCWTSAFSIRLSKLWWTCIIRPLHWGLRRRRILLEVLFVWELAGGSVPHRTDGTDSIFSFPLLIYFFFLPFASLPLTWVKCQNRDSNDFPVLINVKSLLWRRDPAAPVPGTDQLYHQPAYHGANIGTPGDIAPRIDRYLQAHIGKRCYRLLAQPDRCLISQ